MKISLRQLRKIIKEVAMSPSFGKNNKPVGSPFESKKLKEGLASVQNSFLQAVERDLVLASWSSAYDEGSREFKDDVYDRIKKTGTTVTNEMMHDIEKVINAAWQKAHQAASTGGQKAA